MPKLTEIIPDDIPVWAQDAMDNGQFFNVTIDRIKELELQLDLMTSSRDHAKRLLDSCETALIGRDALNDALEAKQTKALELVELWRKEANRLNRSIGMMMNSDGGSLIELAIKDIEAIYTEGEE